MQKSATSETTETTEEPPLLSAQLVAVVEEESGTPLVEDGDHGAEEKVNGCLFLFVAL